MKKIFTGALALLLLAGAAQAQSTEGKQEHGKHQHGRHHGWMKDLNLTADQKSRLKTIHAEQRKEMEGLKGNTALTADQMKAKRAELHRKYADQAQLVYTPEQKQQIEKMKADWKAKGKDHARDGRSANHHFAEKLNLTQEQKDRLKQLRTDSKSQFEALRNDKSLTDEQKKARFKDLRKQQHEQMKTVLTKEQLEKMQSFHKDRGAKNTK